MAGIDNTSRISKGLSLEQEAKKFTQVKRAPQKKSIKPLTARRYMAGQALAGILSNHNGPMRMQELIREAYEWADAMLEYDT